MMHVRGEEMADWRFRYRCHECGREIDGFPYMTTWQGWCACFDPYDFCSEACWAGSDLNTANWPPPADEWPQPAG
jgi:hypothetical protein